MMVNGIAPALIDNFRGMVFGFFTGLPAYAVAYLTAGAVLGIVWCITIAILLQPSVQHQEKPAADLALPWGMSDMESFKEIHNQKIHDTAETKATGENHVTILFGISDDGHLHGYIGGQSEACHTDRGLWSVRIGQRCLLKNIIPCIA